MNEKKIGGYLDFDLGPEEDSGVLKIRANVKAVSL